MKRYFLIAAAIGFAWVGSASARPDSRASCRPTYVVLAEPVKIRTGASELSFNLLAVGCEELLARAWPPKIQDLEREFTLELKEPHPVQILFLIRERSPDLRQRLTRRLNHVLGKPVVSDVFLYGAKAAE